MSLIAAPGAQNTTYMHKTLRVNRYAVNHRITDIREIYGQGVASAAPSFRKLPYEEKPDLVHFHAFTSGVSLDLVREAKQQGLRTVFTYHTPTVTCMRGTLMRWGTEVCDGYMNARLCTQCTLTKVGLNKLGSCFLVQFPLVLAKYLETGTLKAIYGQQSA